MLKLSQFPIKTLKNTPTGSENKSTGFLLQGGFIRQELAGAYSFLPMGLRVLKKIEQIVREEMENIGAFEMLMPALWSQEHWNTTWRWEMDVLFHLDGAGNSQYALNATHEEIVAPLVREFVQSYKDLNFGVYQIQNKFRNEPRAKSGILRGREFLMKDLYSFHRSEAELDAYYMQVKEAYERIFERLGIGVMTFYTSADGGTFTDKFSHEFQTKTEIWEDLVFRDAVLNVNYNQEVAPVQVGKAFENMDEEEKSREDVLWEGLVWVEKLAKFLGIEVERTTKTILFETNEEKVVAVAIRGDYDVNQIKLRKILRCESVKLLTGEKVREVTGAEVGYAWIIGLPSEVQIIWDDSCQRRRNFEMGANQTNYHSVNVNFRRDVEEPREFFDVKEAKEWDINPESGEQYEVFKASEVGNIFPLMTKFSEAFKMEFSDENGANFPVIMGCYGLGVSRAMGVVAEVFCDEEGLVWPENVAPYDVYMIVMKGAEEEALQLAEKFEKEGKSVIFDDRMDKKSGFGKKASDADLLGIPVRVVVSPKTLEQGGYEIMSRCYGEAKIEAL